LEAQSRAGDFASASALIGLIREELTRLAPLLERQRGVPPLSAV
jgi:hypothetical protein